MTRRRAYSGSGLPLVVVETNMIQKTVMFQPRTGLTPLVTLGYPYLP